MLEHNVFAYNAQDIMLNRVFWLINLFTLDLHLTNEQ